jgi:hypothetical protein
MNYLTYCIFHTPGLQNPGALSGVDDQPVALVSNNGLTAAISGITQPNLLPDVSRILTYKRVVEFFHRDRTVIPMRYGCTFNGKQQVCRLLEEHGGQYGRLLGTIKGCVEMGIRILIADGGLEIAELKKNERQFLFNGDKSRQGGPKSKTPGRAYLSARKIHYDREDQVDKEFETVLSHFHRVFSGLYIRFKSEFQNHLLSLYFLVPREAVKHFRQVFLDISQDAAAKLLLSGPWPPYNFVMPISKIQG